MGFYEDDRIRHKNASATAKVEIKESKVELLLREASIGDVVAALSDAGFKVKLNLDNTISVSSKNVYRNK